MKLIHAIFKRTKQNPLS